MENGDRSPVFSTGDGSGICCDVYLDGGACQTCAIEWNQCNSWYWSVKNASRVADSDQKERHKQQGIEVRSTA